MKLLITGGVGFIGTNISILAKEKGYDVLAFDSLIRASSEENIPVLRKHGIEIIRGDVRNKEDFDRIGKIDAVIHLAGNPGIPWSIKWPLYDYNVNSTGTLNVLDYAKTNGKIPVIFASTNKAYSDIINEVPIIEKETRYEWDIDPLQYPTYNFGLTKKGINENFPTEGFGEYPHSPYGVSKLAADHYCQEYYHAFSVPTVINRMSCVYGYYQKGVEDQGWIDWFVRSIAFGKGNINIYGDGKQVRDMLWGEDVAELYLLELEQIEKTKGQVFNIGGSSVNTCSLNEAIKIIEDNTGKKANIAFKEWRHADQKIYISDTRKVNELLGWKQKVTPTEGILKMINAYRENKYAA